MRFHLNRALVAGALATALALAGCSGTSSQSGSESGAQSQPSASSTAAPTVDRSGNGNFPAVTGAFGEKPTIAAGSGAEPTQIIVKTLSQGKGAEVSTDDAVLADYAGALWNGTVFDSSFTKGSPVAFSLGSVIQGWKYGLAGQHVGDRVELVIPSQWGYGETGSGDAQSGKEATIPANATLVFVVDIIDAASTTDTSALKGATPTDDALPAGVKVSGDLGAEPKITFSGDTQPATSETVIAKGKGAEITSGDYVVYQYSATYSKTLNYAYSTWTTGAQVSGSGVSQLVGQTVGSRILLTTAPTGSSSTAQSGDPGIEESTLMVVDILGVLHAGS